MRVFPPIVSRALEMVPPDSLDSGRLSVRQGSILGQQEGNYDGAQAAFGRALTIARREGDMGLEMSTLACATRVDFHHNSFQKCIDEGLLAIELAHQVDDLRAELEAHYYVSASLFLWLGDHAEASSHATVMLGLAEKLRDRQWLIAAFNIHSILSVLNGDWVGQRDYSDRGLNLWPADGRLLSARARTEYLTGNVEQGDVYLQRLIAAVQRYGFMESLDYTRAALAIGVGSLITGVGDNLEVAESFVSEVLASPSPTPSVTHSSHAGLALLAVARGDAGASGEWYSALDSHSRPMVEGGAISIGRLLGLLAHTMKDLDQATVHFEDALTFCRKAGYRPELAWTCCDYADVLRERVAEGDRAKATTLLDESLAISSELGMRPLMERVLSRREILKA
jgi:tetratricopeptide (TPR) repeat protein